ncbi:uncharacterized protein LOC128678889 [Plodia interpunctella]|uniref:uncharacterized protein LOC128678889 n=1 Tax=Plodia interpunctella TaxID=58824 RepID=UPI0023683A10|nr:uncharacterized protein LOC128678889 [Plodia interpunctella]
MKALLTIYDPVDPNIAYDDSMSANIRRHSDKVFKGITIAVIFFGSCALISVISACFYCCRINHSDRILRGDVKALAKKINRDQKIKKPKKAPRKIEEESCNIVVEDAGLNTISKYMSQF